MSLLLTSCSIHTPLLPAQSNLNLKWHNHKQLVAKINSYKLSGAFAYISNTQKVYARFYWEQIHTDHYRILLLNLIGQKQIDLYVRPGVVQIIDNHNQIYVSDDALIKKLLGIDIPLKNLCQWMLGLPGNTTNFTLDQRGYLHKIYSSHNGQYWTVTYKCYHYDTVPALPANLEIQQGENSIKFKIDNWSLS
ncbi:lipoprotein insertase outer membrane protein LolB [Candidatus Palibaumannia cicadellinicola]|nr:lipoprotein insertase outer membrane protein LolB [Candidatus Baumannia cicadellinicola]